MEETFYIVGLNNGNYVKGGTPWRFKISQTNSVFEACKVTPEQFEMFFKGYACKFLKVKLQASIVQEEK